MYLKFGIDKNSCDDTPRYILPVAPCELYSFAVPKKDVPFVEEDPVLLLGFETCDGERFPASELPLTDGSECDYTDRTAVAYFKVKYVAPFNCRTDEIIIFDANARTDCKEGVPSAVLAGGLPENFGSGLRAFYGTDPVVGYGRRIANADDYIEYLLFVSAIPLTNSPYYGTMTHSGGGVIKWEIPEPDFITAFGHSPNEVKLSFCSNGTNLFDIEVLQDFTTCFTDDPNGLHGCGIAWARFTDTSNFPLQANQSVIFTYQESTCTPDDAIIELRWDDPIAASINNITDYLNWLIFYSDGWINSFFINGSDVYIYFNVGSARDIGIELCGTFFKFCGYNYGGGGYAYSAPPAPLKSVTQPVCCNADTLCPKRYDYWFAQAILPDLDIGTRGRFFITLATLDPSAPIYYSNEVEYQPVCNSTYIRFRNNQDFAGQPYSQYPLFWNTLRIGFLFRDISFPQKEVVSFNSAGVMRRIYYQGGKKYACETDYFDDATHAFFRLILKHDNFEAFDDDTGYFSPYISEGDYDINRPNVKPFARTAKATFSLTQSNDISTNSYC